MSAAALTALKDLTSSSFGEVNITDETYQAITAGTGISATHADVGQIHINNTTGGALTFKLTVPTPVDSGLDLINKTVTTKDYTVPANKEIVIANMGAYNDPNNDQKIVFDASATGLEVLCFKPVVAGYKGQSVL